MVEQTSFNTSSSGNSPDACSSLSKDLPPKEALYLFIGFSSYMRAPMQGSPGIVDDTGIRDTVKLLDHARCLAQQPLSNVHLLHLKYRFGGSSSHVSKQLIAEDKRQEDQVPVPQPFAVLHDPVIKIDYKDSGIFEPMPVPAISRHISQHCHPLPRVIVVSYVASNVTETHIAGLAAWAVSQQPPIYVFSPNETRLREIRPLSVALGNAIPLSMYGLVRLSATFLQPPSSTERNPPNAATVSAEQNENGLRANRKAVHTTRIPLWTLASGAGFLAGFTAKTWQIRISDFFAAHLPDQMDQDDPSHPWHGLKVRTPQARSIGNVPSPASHGNAGAPSMVSPSPLRSPPLVPRTQPLPHHMSKGWKKENKERMEDALDGLEADTKPDETVEDLIWQMEEALRLVNDASHGVDQELHCGDSSRKGRASGMLLTTLT